MKTSPQFARALLRRFCNIEFLEEIEGDLEEQFQERIAQNQHTRAYLAYWRDVLQALMTRRSSRKDTTYRPAHRLVGDKLRHLVLASARHLQRNKFTTIINTVGLSVSLATFIFIALYVIDESTYDSMHPDAAQVYRISESFKFMGDNAEQSDARAPGLWMLELKKLMPEIIQATRMSRFGYPGTIKNEKRDILNVEHQVFWVDSTFTDIFALPMISGANPRIILNRPNQVIINESMAVKYFGAEDPIGKELIYARDGMDIPLLVAGVMKKYPSNTHFHPDILSSNLALAPLWNRHGEINSSYSNGTDRVNSWYDAFTYSYMKLRPGTDLMKVDRTLRNLIKANMGDDANYVWPTFTRLTDIHFRSGMVIDLESAGDPIYIYLFGSIGFLILLIACINYMNMATAKSMQRSREVGLRKILGVHRANLIFQFIGESMILTSVAMLMAFVLVGLFLPGFHTLTGCTITLAELFTSKVLLVLIGLTIVVGLISGSYPAFLLSGFKPLSVIKGKANGIGHTDTFRKSLVIFQFTVTLVLIVGTLIIRQQLSFINEAKLSKFKDQILTVRIHGLASPSHLRSFVEKVKHYHSVEGVASGMDIPRHDRYGPDKVKIQIEAKSYLWDILDVDFNFPNLFDLEFVSGRNFSVLNVADSNAVIINQAALKDLNVTAEKAVGLTLGNEMSQKRRTIIGVVKDFSIASLRRRIEPLAIVGSVRDTEVMYIKLSGKNFAEDVRSLEAIWKESFPSAPFNRWFLNKQFSQLYHQEQSTGTLFAYFAALGIFIGCLGLFGLASFTVEQRTKEIGIRKVLGATGLQILTLITYRFVKLMLISMLIGIPLSMYLMGSWQSRFAYHAEISWLIFAGSALLMLALTCLTVSIEAMQAALKNPVEAISHE